MAENLKVVLSAEDRTGNAFKSMQSKLGSIATAAKGFVGVFVTEKIISFFKESIKAGAEADKGLKKSFTAIGDKFRGFQVSLTRSILGNKDFMDGIMKVAEVAMPIFIKALESVIFILTTLGRFLFTIGESLITLYQVITGKISLKEAFSKWKDGAVEFGKATKESFTTLVTTGVPAIKSVSAATKEHTKTQKDLTDEYRKSADESERLYRASLKRLRLEGTPGIDAPQDMSTLGTSKGINGTSTEIIAELQKRQQERMAEASKINIPAIVADANAFEPVITGLQNVTASATSANQQLALLRQGIDLSKQGFSDFAITAINEFGNFKDAAQAAGQASVQALIDGKNPLKAFAQTWKQVYAEVWKKRAQSQMAAGIEKIAEGIWPPNPAAFASAAQHFAAAALFSKLAGGIGGGTAGGSGGGRSGGAAGGANNPRPREDVLRNAPTTIQVIGGLLDMTDPRQSDAFAKALSDTTGRNIVVVGA